ncbi:hypothetical protein SISSUDRAFT_1124873 [Sistotremastrum suecicum HHB10207 ss-3]|uniref:Uncharacterized protein n=1 Tax=Sistotremastrum suecicum HHB10207 ss-3 TaxID=1314776 RepID=A0A166I385_9AGAM|nr:hypothetical protein SISSUDRAFT_1124873 [Sistotremastrum suecicum HHB10207 ss-3]
MSFPFTMIAEENIKAAIATPVLSRRRRQVMQSASACELGLADGLPPYRLPVAASQFVSTPRHIDLSTLDGDRDHSLPPSFATATLDAPPSYTHATQGVICSLANKIVPGTPEGEKLVLEISLYSGLYFNNNRRVGSPIHPILENFHNHIYIDMIRSVEDISLVGVLTLPYMSEWAFEPPRTQIKIMVGAFELEIIDDFNIRVWTIVSALVHFFSCARSAGEQAVMVEEFMASRIGSHDTAKIQNKAVEKSLRYVDFLWKTTVLGCLKQVVTSDDTFKMYLVVAERGGQQECK